MTKRQAIALQFPCARAIWESVFLRGRMLSSILTVSKWPNSEQPVWQASVAFLGSQGRTTPVARLTQANRGILIDAAKELLGGVGGVPSSVEQLELAIRYRRSFTDKELQLVRRDWRAMPAIKEDGRGIVLEQGT